MHSSDSSVLVGTKVRAPSSPLTTLRFVAAGKNIFSILWGISFGLRLHSDIS